MSTTGPQLPGTGHDATLQELAAGAEVPVVDGLTIGQEAERERRRSDLAGFTIDTALLDVAPAHALVMHYLPAHRGEEIAADVLDGPCSLVPRQVENRLHAVKAILAALLSYPEA
jgi:ornithine carbamoyltransferase